MGIGSRAVLLDPVAELLNILGGGGLPTTVFVDEHGSVAKTYVEELSREALMYG